MSTSNQCFIFVHVKILLNEQKCNYGKFAPKKSLFESSWWILKGYFSPVNLKIGIHVHSREVSTHKRLKMSSFGREITRTTVWCSFAGGCFLWELSISGGRAGCTFKTRNCQPKLSEWTHMRVDSSTYSHLVKIPPEPSAYENKCIPISSQLQLWTVCFYLLSLSPKDIFHCILTICLNKPSLVILNAPLQLLTPSTSPKSLLGSTTLPPPPPPTS